VPATGRAHAPPASTSSTRTLPVPHAVPSATDPAASGWVNRTSIGSSGPSVNGW
jgi:hypothetical protein